MEITKTKVGKIYMLPADTDIWCIDLQETISFNKPMYIRITSGTYDNSVVFGKLQTVYQNIALQSVIGKDAISYVDKPVGEIECRTSILKKV